MKRVVIYRWDLDKTYLKTDFETLKGLLRAAFQRAEEKEAYPGATALLKELQENPQNEIFFISGSPEQLRKKLEVKLKTDGIRWKKLILKPNLKNLLLGRFRALKEQVSYKLPVLIEERLYAPEGSLEVLFGDDAETDAFIYSLYANLLAGKVRLSSLEAVLRLAGAPGNLIDKTLKQAEKLQKHDAVIKILIHLEGKTPPGKFEIYGSKLAPFFNYFQASLVLYSLKLLPFRSLVNILNEFLISFGYSPHRLANTFQDAVRRNIMPRESALQLIEELEKSWESKKVFIPHEFARRLSSIQHSLEKMPSESPDALHRSDIDFPSLYVEETRKAPQQRKTLLEKLLE